MKKAELLKTEHEVQLNWVSNQVAKVASKGQKSFLNADAAERAFRKLESGLVIENSDLEHFIGVHLSKVGLGKLVTTLRVYKKRNNSSQLQVDITTMNKLLLDKAVLNTGKTKIEIINSLIENADFSVFLEKNRNDS